MGRNAQRRRAARRRQAVCEWCGEAVDTPDLLTLIGILGEPCARVAHARCAGELVEALGLDAADEVGLDELPVRKPAWLHGDGWRDAPGDWREA